MDAFDRTDEGTRGPGPLADERSAAERGPLYLTGVQALVRLPILQRMRDLAAGLDTAGFVSGYRGSPLGGFDRELWKASSLLERHRVHFQPGVNEDLAATAVWGTQQIEFAGRPRVQGVFSVWYGKSPGVDRSADVLKHGNMAGSARHGGVLLVAGDDHGCRSSTLPNQSEQVFAAAMIPVLNPASVQEFLDFGLYGFELSRYSGCWIAFKATADTVESAASVEVDPDRSRIVLPEREPAAGDLNIRWPDPPHEQERRLHGPKMRAVAAFARANPIDRIVIDAPRPRLGIAATGKAYLDVRQAFDDLGLSAGDVAGLGIRVYKIGLSWPLHEDGALRFAAGLEEVLVVEEKRAFVEDQLMRVLYHLAGSRRPRVVGKRDESGATLLPSEGELRPSLIARAILQRLAVLGLDVTALQQRLALRTANEAGAAVASPAATRAPFFCSGCPHSTSTRLPEGSRGLAGIGCHGMVMTMPARRTIAGTHMGGEGATWIGQSPFVAETHVFQNLGDGTYQHSGLLAIRAAAAAGVNITYKILYNSAVAMTGGQALEGAPSVGDIARQVAAEGARRVVVVADDPARHSGSPDLPPTVDVLHRDRLDAVQRELRETPGLTVLIYDQACATEKRRRRKRGLEPDAPVRVMINPAVCDDCGDCSAESNCISVKPLDTALGRKRTIDQSSCNVDLSCLKGHCPSFVTLRGARPRRPLPADGLDDPLPEVPMPAAAPLGAPYGILIGGIGGAGVLTISALLGTAAHLEGRACSVLDCTGLAQKNGAVTSHVRIGSSAADLHATRLSSGGADLILGCDLVVAAGADQLAAARRGRTQAIVNADVQPTAAFVMDNGSRLPIDAMRRALSAACGDDRVEFVDAGRAAMAVAGDAIGTNLFMLGYALQKGLIPLSVSSIERAIELNGVAVAQNKRLLAWARLAAHDPRRFETLVSQARSSAPHSPVSLSESIETRASHLARYQDERYARSYRAMVEQVRTAEEAVVPGERALTQAVADALFRLMAYKDEYEVARLHSDPAFRQQIAREFDGAYAMEFHLAAPFPGRGRSADGRLRKRAYGAWVLPLLAALAAFRRLRGTPLDPFGYTAERRMERRLIADYVESVRELAANLSGGNHELAVAIARLPETVRGYGDVKARNVAAYEQRRTELMDAFRRPRAVARTGAAVPARVPTESTS